MFKVKSFILKNTSDLSILGKDKGFFLITTSDLLILQVNTVEIL